MGFNIFSTSTWWAACIDLAPNFSGSPSATMNTSGNPGGWVSPILTAYIATHFGWTQALDFAALMTLAAAMLWLGVNAAENLEAPQNGFPSPAAAPSQDAARDDTVV
jgi:MFS transporter, ACS family, glucarate transporter